MPFSWIRLDMGEAGGLQIVNIVLWWRTLSASGLKYLTWETSLSSLPSNIRRILLKPQEVKWELEAAHEFLDLYSSFLTRSALSVDRSPDLTGQFQETLLRVMSGQAGCLARIRTEYCEYNRPSTGYRNFLYSPTAMDPGINFQLFPKIGRGVCVRVTIITNKIAT